jgi:hypothetical protein
MANYEVTATDETKGHISFDVLLDGDIILSDTRCDVPLDDLDAQDTELTRFSDVVIADYQVEE